MLDRPTSDDIIRRVVETAQPEKIILFGSAARDEMGPNSGAGLPPSSFLREQESSLPAPSACRIKACPGHDPGSDTTRAS